MNYDRPTSLERHWTDSVFVWTYLVYYNYSHV